MATDVPASLDSPGATAMPVLYSFRRCPYAMRARMALIQSNTVCELREIVLRNKPGEMLAASAKGTVPVLVLPDGTVMDESLDIMHWALGRHDPDNWLRQQPPGSDNTPQAESMQALIEHFDTHFKHHLDRYKYATRYQHENNGDGVDPVTHRAQCLSDLEQLDNLLASTTCLFGNHRSLADIAIAPFVRQFANTDAAWFESAAPGAVQRWLNNILSSSLFTRCMQKYPVWSMTGPGEPFPPPVSARVK